MIPEFVEFPKIARLSREIVVTEKIDGTNGVIYIAEDGLSFLAGSRSRWITEADDNFGFAKWAMANKDELLTLGPGSHHGEWWGSGVQRGYGLTNGEKRFSLFHTDKWAETRPACCSVVPVLYRGMFDQEAINDALTALHRDGSMAAPGFMNPEGVIVWHTAARIFFKKTLHKDDERKGRSA